MFHPDTNPVFVEYRERFAGNSDRSCAAVRHRIAMIAEVPSDEAQWIPLKMTMTELVTSMLAVGIKLGDYTVGDVASWCAEFPEDIAVSTIGEAFVDLGHLLQGGE